MADQLSLELPEPAPLARRYGCCGMPCPSLDERATAETPFPHAADCENPNLGSFVHRETGMTMRKLHCGDDVMAGRKPCPMGGRFNRTGVFDPFGGRCCLELRRGAGNA